MTPSQLEHLKLLDAHLGRLLETAKKRTPGEWNVSLSDNATPHLYTGDGSWRDGPSGEFVAVMPAEISRSYNSYSNATYIASCAGNAEAGWISTKFAIAGLQSVINMTEDPSIRFCAESGLKTILSSWPLELITKHQ